MEKEFTINRNYLTSGQMTREDIKFAKKANSFVVKTDNEKKCFDNFTEAAKEYNKTVRYNPKKTVELSAVSGIVGITLTYHTIVKKG